MARGKNYKSKKYTKSVSKAVKKYVHRIIDTEPERKQWLTAVDIIYTGGGLTFPNFTPISSTGGSVVCLNVQSNVMGKQGVGNFGRIGDKIKIHDLWIKGTLQVAAGQGQQIPLKVRHIVVIDRKADGVALSTTELMTSIILNQGVSAPFNEKYKHSHTILHDKTFDINSSTYVAGIGGGAPFYQGAATRDYHFKHHFKHPLICTYYSNSVAENISSVEGPAIYSILFSSSGGTNAIDQQASIVYTDA